MHEVAPLVKRGPSSPRAINLVQATILIDYKSLDPRPVKKVGCRLVTNLEFCTCMRTLMHAQPSNLGGSLGSAASGTVPAAAASAYYHYVLCMYVIIIRYVRRNGQIMYVLTT
jgi:hypothetical protein